MPTYAYMNLTGSTGKTATTIATAYILAKQGLTVEIIDLDHQANVTTGFGYPYFDGKTIGHVLLEQASLAEIVLPARLYLGDHPETEEPVYEPIPNITIVPSGRAALEAVNNELAAASGGVNRLRKALIMDADQRADSQPDIRLFDCGGMANKLQESAALAVTAEDDERRGAFGILTCSKPAGKEAEGIPDLLEKAQLWSDTYNRRIEVLSIVPTIVPPQGGLMSRAERDARQYRFRVSGAYREMLTGMEDTYDGELVGGVTPPVRRTTQVDHAFTARVPLPYFNPSETREIMADYEAVVAYQQERGLFVPRRGLRAA